jgi:hypothetical protein
MSHRADHCRWQEAFHLHLDSYFKCEITKKLEPRYLLGLPWLHRFLYTCRRLLAGWTVKDFEGLEDIPHPLWGHKYTTELWLHLWHHTHCTRVVTSQPSSSGAHGLRGLCQFNNMETFPSCEMLPRPNRLLLTTWHLPQVCPTEPVSCHGTVGPTALVLGAASPFTWLSP